jgi:hypothetical protein
MPKRLGYKTDACMMLIRREVNEWMIENKMNKSRLVNDLLLKYYEWELCHHCLGGVIHSGKCEKCSEPWIRCRDTSCERTSAKCDCSWQEREGLD